MCWESLKRGQEGGYLEDTGVYIHAKSSPNLKGMVSNMAGLGSNLEGPILSPKPNLECPKLNIEGPRLR